jgi:predicted RNA-binding protein
MSFWMFSVTSHKENDRTFAPEEVLRLRIGDRFWGLGEKTPNRRALKRGDKVVFYLGNPHKTFAASAVLASDSFELSEDEQEKVSHGTKFFKAPYGVRLEEAAIWEHPRRVEDLLPALGFIENKEYWWAYFQGGVRQLGERDFQVICENVSAIPIINPSVPLSQPSMPEAQFALESHLEEFMDKNWNHIDFNRKLKRYAIGEQSGRQFPAGQWSIDFLCVDEASKNLVVVELKRGQTSDATVGQVLRYMGWVEENVAEKGQQVEGVIIARDIDDALHYAVKNLPQIQLLTYRVDFTLHNPKR